MINYFKNFKKFLIKKKINLNLKLIINLNNFRLELIYYLNKDKAFKYNYFNLAVRLYNWLEMN